jgi:hypothetical protein
LLVAVVVVVLQAAAQGDIKRRLDLQLLLVLR